MRASPAGDVLCFSCVSADEHLGPVVAVGHIADADLGVGGVQDIGTVAGGIHPAIHHCLRGAVALGDVFTGSPEGNAEIADHLKGRAVNRAVMGKIAVVLHVLGFEPGYPTQLPVVGKRLQAVFLSDLIDQTDDLLLVFGNGCIQSGDVDDLTGIDQVVILDLRIGTFDLAQTHLVFGGNLPHAVAGDNGMAGCSGVDAKHGQDQKDRETYQRFFHVWLPPVVKRKGGPAKKRDRRELRLISVLN